jgi:hypothetical protein
MKHLAFLSASLIVTVVTGAATGGTALGSTFVYAPTAKGIYAYETSSAGKLTPIKGSPFTQTAGIAVGGNGSYFLSVDAAYLHSYKVSSTGAIGEQVSEINTQAYSDAQCGAASAAELDHTGQYVYVLLNGSTINDRIGCAALQTYEIAKTTGVLTFKGATNLGANNYPGVPTIAGNDIFSYTVTGVPSTCKLLLDAFQRESTGVIQSTVVERKDPTPEPNVWDGYLLTPFMTDDPTDHMALALQPTVGDDCEAGKYQLASYTVGSQGNLTSTNTWENMPTLAGLVYDILMSPAGKYLAVATGTGVQVFHFNGASPITPFTGIIGTSGYIDHLGWDVWNHLYALNVSNKLHIYAVTSSGVKEVSGSPYLIPVAVNQPIVVVSQ